MSVLLIDIISSVCVNNLSCRDIHAEVYQREDCAGLFGTNSCFSKRVKANSKECCDAGNKDCWRGIRVKTMLYFGLIVIRKSTRKVLDRQ